MDGFPITVPGNPWGAPVIGNFDDDTTTLEFVLFVVDQGLYAIGHDGSILPGFPVSVSQIGYCDGIRSAALADFDADGKCEIVFQTNDALSIIRYDGTMSSGFPIPLGNLEWACPVIADIDGDGVLEIIAPNGSEDEHLIWAYEYSGDLLEVGYPLRCPLSIIATPIIEDIHGDGKLEIIVPAQNTMLHVWETDAEIDTALMTWIQYRGNTRRTAVIPYGGGLSVKGTNKKPESVSISILPNPFNSYKGFMLGIFGDRNSGKSYILNQILTDYIAPYFNELYLFFPNWPYDTQYYRNIPWTKVFLNYSENILADIFEKADG